MIMNSLSLVNRDAGRLLRLDVRLLLSSAATPSAHGICGQRCDAHHIAVCPKSKRSQKGVQRIIFGHGKMEQGRLRPAPTPARGGGSAAEMLMHLQSDHPCGTLRM